VDVSEETKNYKTAERYVVYVPSKQKAVLEHYST